MTMPFVDVLVRVGLATLLGVAIGIERQWRARMAGLQTMALVGLGASLFLILGAYTFHREQDPTRVAAQIVTGIGFLGAGVIMKHGSSVIGLNTAATLWATAAVGAFAGAWMWREAIAGAAIVIAANGFLYPLATRMDRTRSRLGREIPSADYILDVTCRSEVESAVRELTVAVISRSGLQLRALQSMSAATAGEVRLRAELSAPTRDDAAVEEAVLGLSAESTVRSARWTVEDEAAVNWARGSR